MTTTVFVLLYCNLSLIGSLPRLFFRADGKFNLKWWLTAAPFFLSGLGLLLCQTGVLTPLFPGYPVWRESIAVILAACSIGLIGFTLGSHRIPLALWHQDNDAPASLVTHGAYARIRHPFYSAFLLCLIAAALACPHPVTLACVGFSAVMLNLTAAREEKNLLASDFGAAYRAYLQRSGRFLPRLRSASA